MKIIFTLALLIPIALFAQEKRFETKNIEVWGQAERTIVPNEIYTSITIKEYKAPGKKVNLNDLEKELVRAVKAAGIPDENLRVENVFGYNWDYKKKESDEFFASKAFELKTNDVKKLNDLLARLDAEGLNRVHIKRYTHTDLLQIQKELQLEALKNAKEKAKNLVNGIDEVLGGVLEVQEMQEPMYSPRMEMSYAKTASDSYESNVEFQNMKVTASIRAVFEID